MPLGDVEAHAVEMLDASVVMAPSIGTVPPDGATKSTATVAETLAVPSPLGAMLVKLTLVGPKLKWLIVTVPMRVEVVASSG